jgi:hypothetical protein
MQNDGSFRATATVARLRPRRRATARPQLFKLEKAFVRIRSAVAAS